VRRNWVPLSVSAVVHLLFLAAALELSRPDREHPAGRPYQRTDPARQVELVYLPPVAPALPIPQPSVAPPPPKPVALPPVRSRKEPEPEPNAPPEAVRAKGTESDDPRPAEGNPTANPPAAAPAPTDEPIATLESEARRIFGRPRLATPPGAGPQAVRPMQAYLPDHNERCTPRPPTRRDSAGSPQLGTVIGRIFEQGSGRPLAGAHLQMLGAPYVAFTDSRGEYRFRFDMALVDNCRTQYVRVTARGYQTRLLVLTVGPDARSEDVRLRRR
jgi:hypothetical protein